MGIFDFLRKRRERGDQRKMHDQWMTVYGLSKAEIMKRIDPLVSERHPEYVGTERLRFLLLAAHFTTSEPPSGDIEAIIAASPASWSEEAAQIAGDALSNNDQQLNAVVAQVEYSRAMLLMGGAYNPDDPFHPNADMLYQALFCIEEAIKLGPAVANYCSTGVQICGMLHDYETGYRYATTALEADPENPEAWRMAGLASIGIDRYAEAEERLLRARQLWPGISGIDDALALARARK